MIQMHTDKYIERCPYCGGTEFIEAFQAGYGAVIGMENKLGGCALMHSVCRECGTVVRTYVKDPEKLLKRSDRKPY